MNPHKLKDCLEQIIKIANDESYDEQAREYMKSWAQIALSILEKNQTAR